MRLCKSCNTCETIVDLPYCALCQLMNQSSDIMFANLNRAQNLITERLDELEKQETPLDEATIKSLQTIVKDAKERSMPEPDKKNWPALAEQKDPKEMTEQELKYTMAYCENMTRKITSNSPSMDFYERRRAIAEYEWTIRKRLKS